MYIINPYKSINNLALSATIGEIELLLGTHPLGANAYAPEYVTGIYKGGIMISYKGGQVCYIGIHTSLAPIMHLAFDFSDKGYFEVIDYFKSYPGDIFIEEEVAVISEYLGISTYFEDGLKEVAIFSKEYGSDIIKGLKRVVNSH